MYIRNGEEQASGTVEEKIVKQGDNILFIYTQTIPAGDFIDSVIIDSQTRLPIRYSSNLTGIQSISVDYGEKKAEVSIYRNTKNSKLDTLYTEYLSELVYDGVWHQSLLYSIPNGNLNGLSLPIYTYKDGLDEISFTEIEDEELVINDITYSTTKFSGFEEKKERQFFFWIDKSSNKTIKYLVEVADNFIAGMQMKNLP